MEIHLLNHAAIIVRAGHLRLLCDPWLFGTCFRDGWGLAVENPDALDQAQDCTHLWISHFHSDHLHVPTLSRLLERRPSLVVIANVSANFSMRETFERLGFQHIIPFLERIWLDLDGAALMRYPTSGIDNMLVVRTRLHQILNYNDCNLPRGSLRRIAKKIGPVDVLLSSYNHGGKLLEGERRSPDEIRRRQLARFREIVDAIGPRWVIPFASGHYYRAPGGWNHNDSLLSPDDVACCEPRTIPLKSGESVAFEPGQQPVARVRTTCMTPARRTLHQARDRHEMDALLPAATQLLGRLRSGFPGVWLGFPVVRILVDDLGEELVLDPRRGSRRSVASGSEHMTAHSCALMDWFGTPFGTDAFLIGAHLEIRPGAELAVRRFLLACLLIESRLCLRSVLRMLTSRAGWRFLYNRREEIWGVLRERRFHVSYRIGPADMR